MDVMSSERVMRRLFEVSAEHDQGFCHQVQAMLEVGCHHFGLKIGILSHISGDLFELAHLRAPKTDILVQGAILPLAETLAIVALEADGPVGFTNLAESPYHHHKACNRWDLKAYLGVPVRVDGSVYGTLSFSCFHSRSKPFVEKELEVMQLMASWLGREIQRQQSQERLKKAEEGFRLGVEASPASMIMVDRGGGITYANTRAQELFGYRFADLVGAPIEILVPETARAAHPEFRKDFNAEGGSRAMNRGRSLTGVHSTGRPIPIEVGLNTIETPYGSFTLCTILDMTERLEFEREILDKTQKLEEANRTLSSQALTDDLTGLFNRRALFSHMETIFRLARRQGSAVSVLLADVDNFKDFNDTAGHQAGDEALRRVAQVMKDAARRSDIVARYGGEEFVLVLPETNMEGARELAERIREQVAVLKGLAKPLTISVGVSSLVNADPGTEVTHLVERMIHQADDALYEAKHAGRNEVACFTDSK